MDSKILSLKLIYKRLFNMMHSEEINYNSNIENQSQKNLIEVESELRKIIT